MKLTKGQAKMLSLLGKCGAMTAMKEEQPACKGLVKLGLAAADRWHDEYRLTEAGRALLRSSPLPAPPPSCQDSGKD